MAYVTLAEYKAYMGAMTRGQPTAYLDSDDTFITGCLTAAQQYIEEQTGRKFEATTATRYYDERAVDYLTPARLLLDDDLLSVTTLTNGNAAAILAADYYLEPYNTTPKFAVTLKSGAWSFSTSTGWRIAIAGSWGYSATANQKVKDMTMRLAYLEMQRRTATGEVTVMGDGVFSFQASIPKDIAEWLTFWHRMRAY